MSESRKDALMIVMSMSFLFGMALTSAIQNPLVIHVAADGKDTWSGRLESPNTDGTDGPFATLERARDAIRALKGPDGALTQPVSVVVGEGTYFLQAPLQFTPEDSGTEACPVTYAAAEGTTPVISGGQRITDWELASVNGKQVWVADLPEVHAGEWLFHQLWVNGARRLRARYPNQGYLKVAEVPDATSETPWHEGQTRFRFEDGDLQAYENLADVEVTVMTRWTESKLPVTEVDVPDRMVHFGKRSVFQVDPGDLYYVENALELMDVPGEWTLNREQGKLYYLPMPGETMDRAEIIAPRLIQLMRLEGSPEAGQTVEHLHFEGLHFAHTEWWFQEFVSQWPKPDVGGFPQAAIGVPGAVYAEGARHCTFERCELSHLGTYGLELARGCQHNRVLHCEIGDLGAGGVKIGETVIRENEAEQTHSNEVSGCAIHDGGIVFHSAIGMWVGQSFDNRLTYNHIHDFYYSGFSIGWTWGYGNALARGNVIEHNHAHHLGIKSNGDGPILSDMGGIYTLGMQPGTVIRHNRFHDIAGLRYGGWGIYFDEGSTHILAENNLVYRTTHGGFHQHYGRENMVRNNIFAFARDFQIQRSRSEEHLSFTFERNIVYWRDSILFSGNLTTFRLDFDRNLYWRDDGGDIDVGNLSWDAWQQQGKDVHSQIADPLFVDPDQGDFRLKEGSPAFELGFVPFESGD